MHHPRAGFQRAEEIHRMIRRIAEKQRDRRVLAGARAQEGRGRDLDPIFQLGVADRAVAEFDRGARAEIFRRLRHQLRQRAARDRIVPMHAVRIEFFAGVGHARRPVIPGRASSARIRNPGSRGIWIPGLRPKRAHPGMTRDEGSAASHYAAAFDACASDANVLPSAARRFSSGAGSSDWDRWSPWRNTTAGRRCA